MDDPPWDGDGCEERGGLMVLYFTCQSNITDMKDDIGQGGGEYLNLTLKRRKTDCT